MKKHKNQNILKEHVPEIVAISLFLVGALLSMLSLIRRLPLALGVIGVLVLASGLFIFCMKYVSERSYKNYYKDSYEIEHSSIEEEIRKSMTYHMYQEGVLNRYESACRDLGMSDEQKDWLLMLLMEEKNKVDAELKENGGGFI